MLPFANSLGLLLNANGRHLVKAGKALSEQDMAISISLCTEAVTMLCLLYVHCLYLPADGMDHPWS